MDLDRVLREQDGVISRRQVLAANGDDNLIERMLRRRLWSTVHPGVYVDHTGVPTLEQAHQAAVLYAWPAALGGESALVAHDALTDAPAVITVVVDHARRVRDQPGLRVVRMTALEGKVLWNRHPPRLRVEPAALHVASDHWRRRGEQAAVAVLADTCQRRMTTAARLVASLSELPSLPGRAFLLAVLADVADGTHSVLEHRYQVRVERAHGLPRASRQRTFAHPHSSGFRDVTYPDQHVIVELDGRLGHEWAGDQWADLQRDLRAATEQLLTIRVGWGAVSAPCKLAKLVGQILQVRGWSREARSCPSCTEE